MKGEADLFLFRQKGLILNVKKSVVFVVLLVLLIGMTGCSKIKDESSSRTSSISSGASVPESSEEAISQIELMKNSSAAASEASAPEVMNPNYTDLAKLSNQKNGWGQGTQVDANNRPVSCDLFQKKYGKYDAIFIKENSKDFYLTFDEGYENGYTAKILDVLKEKKAPAVFFVTQDYVKKNPELVKRMIAEGHVVGNHSWTHPSMPTVTLEKAEQEIMLLHNYIKENFQYEMTLFRPPMGEYSEQTLALAQQLGYQSIFWSYAYKDWDPKNQPEQAPSLEKALKYAHGGAVYLLHAVSETNTNMLGEFIDGIRAKGYVFKALQ